MVRLWRSFMVVFPSVAVKLHSELTRVTSVAEPID